MFDTIVAEDAGKPSAAIVNKGFIPDGSSAASSKGMPMLRLVTETIPCECTVIEEIESGLSKVMDDIVAKLTTPLTDEERSPKPKETEKLGTIVFQGNLGEVNRFFYNRGWTDGLPVIPPTEEAVAEMLTGTDLPPDHVVTRIIPRMGKATVEKIAINAVMAGALPTYMPILIAGVQALMRSHLFGKAEVSTASWVPSWIINGPIRNQLHVNSNSGAFSPGDIANAAIGRAMGLIIKNIGGARKGKEDMGVYGNPGKYSQVTAENEEESPWEPFHVSEGFKMEDSTISLSFPYSFFWTMVRGSDAKSILQTVIYNTTRGGVLTLVLNPQLAHSLVKEGWTKKEIASHLCEYARIPAYRRIQLPAGVSVLNRSRAPLDPQTTVAVFSSPESIRVLVAGGPGGTGLLLISGGGEIDHRVTQKIELPANWEKLVEKYKDIIPTYRPY